MDTPIAFKSLSFYPPPVSTSSWLGLSQLKAQPRPCLLQGAVPEAADAAGAFVGISIAPWIDSVCWPPVSPLA